MLKSCSRLFKALGDINRLKIFICLLERDELCVCELQRLLDMPQPTVSRHLKILEDAGLLESRRQGQWVIYRFNPKTEFERQMAILIKKRVVQDPELVSLLQKSHKIKLR